MIMARSLATLSLLVVSALSACGPMAGMQAQRQTTEVPTLSGRPLPDNAAILKVAPRIEPVAEEICRRYGRVASCDFIIAVDDDPAQPPNAFQTLDPSGQPVIVFTQSLLDATRNGDEIAFVLGHEAAHHILGHIAQRKSQARSGAVWAGIVAQVVGLGSEETRRAQELAAGISARQYSKTFELEADALGAKLAAVAGFDPIRGASFFARLPDPGPSSSHPSNVERYQSVVHAVGGYSAR